MGQHYIFLAKSTSHCLIFGSAPAKPLAWVSNTSSFTSGWPVSPGQWLSPLHSSLNSCSFPQGPTKAFCQHLDVQITQHDILMHLTSSRPSSGHMEKAMREKPKIISAQNFSTQTENKEHLPQHCARVQLPLHIDILNPTP